jgi:hypothetical protein
MAVYTSPLVHQPKIEKGLKKIVRALKPDVVRIRYSFEDNFMGEPSVYFRVVLSDEAAEYHHLHANAQRVRRMVSDVIDPRALGLEWYLNVRSLAEQEESRNPLWE